MKHTILMTLLLSAAALGCDSSAPPEATSVQVAFSTASSAQRAPGHRLAPQADSLTVTGTNGTLVLTDIRLIVAEFQLRHVERVDDCDAGGTGNPCREFEAAPFFVDLPLGTGSVSIVTDQIPAGTFDALEFEVEDIELDEPDEDNQEVSAVAQEVRRAFPGWPEEATMVVTGTFTPTGQSPTPFTTFFDAEIKVELDIVPALTVEDGEPSRTITVEIDPGTWFRSGDGTVVDLVSFDFDSTGDVADFELDVEGDFEGALEVDLDGADD